MKRLSPSSHSHRVYLETQDCINMRRQWVYLVYNSVTLHHISRLLPVVLLNLGYVVDVHLIAPWALPNRDPSHTHRKKRNATEYVRSERKEKQSHIFASLSFIYQ